MKAIRCLFLDVGGVLLSNGWDRHARARAAAQFKLDAAEFDERHQLSAGTFEEGKLTLEEYLDRVVFNEERPFTRDEFRRFMLAQSTADTAMIALIAALKARHKLKVAVVSNEARELNAYRIQKFGLSSFVDYFVSSCFVRLRKPDAEIFRLALDLAQVPTPEVLYIENTPLFAQVAASLGIKSLVHRDFATTRAELAGLGLAADDAAGNGDGIRSER